MVKITSVKAREIIDSRSNPSVEAEVKFSDGASGVAQVPSGASTGKFEARELRDKNNRRFHKMGCLEAVKNVNDIISGVLIGEEGGDIDRLDRIMIALDGSQNKSNLGANAILSVSLAHARAAADSKKLPLYRYLGGSLINEMPIPMMNILNGGAHAKNNLDIQEFMIIPTGAENFSEGVRICSEVYHTLKNILSAECKSVGVGDEGGFAPSLQDDEEAILMILRAVESAGYNIGTDLYLGIDVAASEWYSSGVYNLPKSGKKMTSDELVGYIVSLSEKYPILSIEDGVGEEDFYAWKRLTEKLSGKGKLLVGDDLFVTDSNRIERGISEKIANAVLIKPNQIGTLSETASAVRMAKRGGYKTIMSHRSGDTEDTFIADLAVALGVDFVKMGAPARAERTAKYNRLMKIESELFRPRYGGKFKGMLNRISD